MRKIVTGLFMSLDGIVGADDQWQFAYFDEELFAGIAAGFARADTVLLGRHSYQGYDALRVEHPDSPMVAFLDGTTRYVVSTTLTEIGWPGTTVLGGDLREQVSRLKRQPGKDILVLGSPTLVRWLLGNGLLDEFNVSVLPIIVGSGVRLFQDMDLPAGHVGLRLAGAKTLASGVLETRYTLAST
ncbi:dihydrofolate reductase family protein [Crossiella cryophila]|uniref:Dihydrofolate reductase n=1 Tax=Crossiella cryophila TaxID=43355 RepID=A0A7W7FWN0_9PSEU|nr:dihydrofolate reductase family protein [Crossiella cryophila]MBB4678099.1 dihydrofolate reductase [Crossiella cryophila]